MGVATLSFFLAAAGQAAEFTVHEMGRWGAALGQTSLVDVDRDGDLDFVVGTRGAVSWWEYRAPDRWVRHDAGKDPGTDVGGIAFDVDGDGWVDHVAGRWFRNTGKPREEPFERIEAGPIGSHDLILADLDGDGRRDVVAMRDRERTIRWYGIPKDPRKEWPEVAFGKATHSGIAAGDLDGDGDIDVVRSTVWYENVDGKGRRWAERPLSDEVSIDTRNALADLDGDGDLDVASSDHDGADVHWIENLDGRGGSWRTRRIGRGKNKLHSILVADLDNDGDADVYAGETEGKAFLWENDGKGGFAERVIAEDVSGHETRFGDVDGDGDLDLCSKPWRGKGTHHYFRNLLVEKGGPKR